jgi:hypothetical protein
MRRRSILRSTTMLSGVVGCTFIATSAALTADLNLRSPTPAYDPAVSAMNDKVEAFAGSFRNKSFYGGAGSVAAPLGGQYGAQIDGTLASLDGSTFGAVGGHWFWRDPSQALLGIYADSGVWDRFGGVNVTHVGGEAERYLGPFTLQGVAGVEFGNSASSATPTILPGLVTTTTTFVDSYNINTRFFDEVNLRYYFTDDLNGYVGHRYVGGKNALALGGELARPLGGGYMGSAFVEGRVGEGEDRGVWGGLKLYFAPTDKPLIARHRRDDPVNWTLDIPLGIFGNHHTSTTSVQTCTGHIGSGGNCESAIIASSDRRLKRDLVLLARRADGIGIYRYRYLWSDTVYVGVMAQELAAIAPEAVVHHSDGFLRVDYARLGMRLLTWNEWQAGKSTMRLAA